MSYVSLTSTSHEPGSITLLSGTTVSDLNRELREMYSKIAVRYLKQEDSDLQSRVRAYDNNQRLTFGRAQSRLLSLEQIKSSLSISMLEQISDNGPDESYFPNGLTDRTYAPLNDVLQYSVSVLLEGNTRSDEQAMVSLLCHRVLVRPQEEYKGFFHRDLAPRHGRIGTIIWYPKVLFPKVEGLEFIAYSASPDEPLGTLRSREPDYKFTPEQYCGNAAVLGYPHNYAHGVLRGINVTPSTESRKTVLEDFVSPPEDCFVKDLVIITISEWSPVEE